MYSSQRLQDSDNFRNSEKGCLRVAFFNKYEIRNTRYEIRNKKYEIGCENVETSSMCGFDDVEIYDSGKDVEM